MLKYRVLLLMIFIAVIGCDNNHVVQLMPGDEIVFDLPFEQTLIPIGYCDRGDTQNSFYYFADFRTSKKIACFNRQGKLSNIINLKSLIKNNAPWYTTQVRSIDSIAAISSNPNELFFFNNDEEVQHQADILPIKYGRTTYSILNGTRSPDLNFDVCYSDIEPNYDDCRDSASGKMDWGKWHATLYSGPALARITHLFSDSPVVTLQFAGLQSRFMKAGTLSGSPVFFNSGTSLYYANTYSDTFYQFDITSSQLIHKVHLQSAYSNMGAPFSTISVSNNDAQAHGDMVRSTKGVIREGKYDKYRKLIYLMFYHEVPADIKPIHKGEHRAWSLFIYNEQLEKLAEIPFKADTYLPQSLIVNPEGILLKKMDINLEERSYKQTFQQFKIGFIQ
jgi:hypothetical protein